MGKKRERKKKRKENSSELRPIHTAIEIEAVFCYLRAYFILKVAKIQEKRPWSRVIEESVGEVWFSSTGPTFSSKVP